MILAFVLAGNSAMAFQDLQTYRATDELINAMQLEGDTSVRLRQLESYKDFLYSRLNTIELPDIDTTPETDPRLEEYRSLTEFDNYVALIRMRQVSAKSCNATKVHIENSTSRDGGVVPEAVEALKILSALCT
ncbi:hypothetical protein predicted by Glimmer/Critica [Bdellovibrio bacteriovorus HD100]|uniref:Uncharacterized protein n=2 Tax=Bdellovibrio bacteriovorus TaxID=959 RepID=Q6MIS4_BDEBA|nr:hypothetical protein EP01_00695 [Bdellovibrio bacteriovorus]CAE80839.1 hypothetical protein predicted by Glimmer/Critica [Bdellovibrio bacteriovorus HD100]